MVHAYQTNETSRIVNIIIITYFHRQDHDEKLLDLEFSSRYSAEN